jgi:tetratricopeptide (TPR) repeat protein
MTEGSDRGFGEITTFYSYKGGTGRSMALANVAYILATDTSYGGKKVLMIDWDLEAPGLHRYFSRDFSTALGVRSSSDRYEFALNDAPGLIEFITAVAESYRGSLPSAIIPESHAATPEALEGFQRAFNASSFNKLLLNVDETPNLYMLKAGRQDDTYADRIRKFDWESFYKQYGSFFTNFRTYLMNEFGFVLIDSRTGLTDVSGICTKVMPEKLVSVFVPNRQNLDGLAGVIRSATGYRSDSRDPRGLVAFPLASRIDGSNSELREIWWHGGSYAGEEIVGYQDRFEKLLSDVYELDECHLQEYFDSTQIPHDAHYAFGERIAARSRSGTSDKLSIGGACGSLARRLATLDAPWEALDQVELAEELRKQETQRRKEAEKLRRQEEELRMREEELRHKAEAEATEARNRIALWVRVGGAAGLVLLLVALFFVGRYVWSKFNEKPATQQTAQVQQSTDQTPAPNNTDVSAIVKAGADQEQSGDFQGAMEKFNEALKIAPDNPPALQAKGYLLLRQGNIDEALTLLQKSANNNPEYEWAHYGLALAYWKKGNSASALDEVRQVLKLDPSFFRTFRGDANFAPYIKNSIEFRQALAVAEKTQKDRGASR